MINITVIAVGRLGEKHWAEAANEYCKRLSAFCSIKIIEIPEYKLPSKPSAAIIEKAVMQEGAAIMSKLPARSKVISLCIEGSFMDSQKLSAWIDAASSETSAVTFVIGGSHGLSGEVKSKSDLRLSMSPMTFPHQLARVMLLEQIYRAFTISANLPYHK